MKTQITFGAGQGSLGTLMLFFICFLVSLNCHSQKIQSWLAESWKNETWENSSKTLYTYDGNGYLINSLIQNFDVTWKDQFQIIYNNNPDGTVQQSIAQSWNTTSNAWRNSSRTTNTYTAVKKLLTSETSIWNTTDWLFSSKQIHTYDANNYEIKSVSQTYDVISPWRDASQTTFTNNPDGTVNQEVTQTWNFIAWGNTDRITYTYDSSKLITSEVREKWNGTIWGNSERITSTYNNSKLITELTEKWNGTIWENFSMDTNVYDGSGNLTSALSQDWVAGSWKNDVQSLITNNANGTPIQIVSQDWDDVGLVWKNTVRITYTYDPSLGIDENVFEKSFTFYPNPAQDKITIKTNDNNVGTKYLITDQLGRQFLNGTITNLETVLDVAQFSNGIYFIQVGQNKNETIKLIKK